jgi:tartrate dehydrogenase/decarboxylase/D-malate dehydrogenase
MNKNARFSIAVYPGDGIGIEVTEAVVRVLAAIQKGAHFQLDFTYLEWGSEFWHKTGQVVPDDYLDTLREFDAIYLGALGDPDRIPDHITLVPIIEIRQHFDQYACVRPAKLYPGVASPLARPEDIDFVVIRENSEGEYLDNGGRFKVGTPDEVAIQSAIHTRRGVERILRFGFDMARQRRHHLTMVTKSNALKYGLVLWDDVLKAIAPEYPDVTVDKQHIDAASMNFVRRPETFDVVVTTNLFGDILSDLGGMLVGGLGFAPSANINPERRFPSMFEPVHGSAPDIMGQWIANPVAAIVAAGMMLDWLGLSDAANQLNNAVEAALAGGAKTVDMGGKLSTREMTDAIIDRLG